MTLCRSKFLILIISLFGAVLVTGCGNDAEQESSANGSAQTGLEGVAHSPGDSHGEPLIEEVVTVADWCAEHAVPESACTQCNPSLIAGFKQSGDWCAGHNLPESHCRLCNPEIVFPQELVLQAERVKRVADEIEVSLNFRTNAAVCATDGALIQFASATTAERTGLTVQAAMSAPRVDVNDAPAEIVFDETEIVALTISVEALVTKWLVSPGDRVEKGEPLAVLQSPEIARLSSDLVTVNARYQVEKRELERHRQLMEKELISDADWDRQQAEAEQVQAELVSARTLLLSAGLDDEDIARILEKGELSSQFLLRATAPGVIIERMAGIGELLEAGSSFATIGDPFAMWIEARLTERQMHEVDLGSKLIFSSDGGGINRVGGEIIWISRFLDQHTRTGTVRARIIAPDHRLRAGEFGRAEITNSDLADIALVHKDAVQWEGCCNVVFVKEAVDRYRPRKVELVGSQGGYYQISNGVRAGEEIVVDGAFLLKTELKKSSIGAGCCGLDPVG